MIHCEKCEYVCDTPLGSYCTLTNEAVETTECHKDDYEAMIRTQEWLIQQTR